MNAAQNSYSNIYSRRIILCSNSYHIQIQFQYFVAFDLSSISLQSYSNSFFVCNHIFIWILFRFCLRYMFNPFVFAGSRPDESKSRAPQAKKNQTNIILLGACHAEEKHSEPEKKIGWLKSKKKRRQREKQWGRRENWSTEEQKHRHHKENWASEERKMRHQKENQWARIENWATEERNKRRLREKQWARRENWMTEEQKKRRRRKKQWARRENWATEERKKKRQREHWAIEERKKRRRREKQCRMHPKNFNALFGSTPYYAQCHSCFKFRWCGLKHITLFTMSRAIQLCSIMHNVTFAPRMFFFLVGSTLSYSQCDVCGRPHKLQAYMK